MTKKRNAKKCEECGIRPIDNSTQGRDSWACTECFEYAGWENTHSDNAHFGYVTGEYVSETTEHAVDLMDQIKNCPVCNPELDPRLPKNRKIVARDLSKWPVEKSGKNMSHKDCGHPLTKVERAKCRAGKTIKAAETDLDEARKALDDIIAQQEATAAYDPHAAPKASVSAQQTKPCPKCGATGDNVCTTASGGRVRSNGGRHPARDN